MIFQEEPSSIHFSEKKGNKQFGDLQPQIFIGYRRFLKITWIKGILTVLLFIMLAVIFFVPGLFGTDIGQPDCLPHQSGGPPLSNDMFSTIQYVFMIIGGYRLPRCVEAPISYDQGCSTLLDGLK